MRLKYKIGYFISVLAVIIGLVLAFQGIDSERYLMIAGSLWLAFFGLYYFIKGFNKSYSLKKWGSFSVCLFFLLLIGVHFLYEVKIDYFVVTCLFLIRPLYEIEEKNKVEYL
jgi:hypothetical protein